MKNAIVLSAAILFSINSFSQEIQKDTVSNLKEVQVSNKYKYKREKSNTV